MLNFETLPKLPQVESLISLSEKLWTMPEVAALWLGGSFARGKSDQYSDFDLRIAVKPEAIDYWKNPDLTALFGEKYLGHLTVNFGQELPLYQVIIEGGVLFDLSAQTVGQKPPQDYVLVLGCRDPEFGNQLVSAAPPVDAEPPLADPQNIRQVIIDFWISTSKHAKVLHRSLEGLVQIGIGFERSTLLRLWHILATGRDSGVNRPTIHSMTATVRTIEAAIGESALAITGAPTRNRAEIIAAVDLNRDEVSRVGNLLAKQLNFEYPQKLEASIRAQWIYNSLHMA